jgi:hypothetical protein
MVLWDLPGGSFVFLTVLAWVYGCVLLDVSHWYLWLFKCLKA